MAWQFVLGPASGGHAVSVTQARSRSMTFRLTDPHEAGFQISANTPAGKYVNELTTDLHCIRDGKILYRGRVGTIGDDGDEKGGDVTDVRTFDYAELLKRRRLYTGDTLTFTSIAQSEIAWGLINNTQVRAGGSLNIVKGTGHTTNPILRSNTYAIGDSIGDLIKQLSEVSGGFHWDIEPVDQVTLALNIYYPARGANRGVVLEKGGLIRSYRRETDPGSYANQIRITGDSTLPAAGEVRAASDIATRLEGVWDAVYGTDIKNSQALKDRADWQLANAQVVPVSYTLVFKPDKWKGPSHVWLGDTVQVVVKSGRLNANALYIVQELAVSLDDNGNETVTVQVGSPNPGLKYKPGALLRRINELERR
jgi:hypothetical protein